LRLSPHPDGVEALPPFYGLMFLGALRLIPLWLAWVGCFGLCRELTARKKILLDWRLSWIHVDLTGCPSTSTALWDQFEWIWQPD
jgi:hypothetical protein